MAVPASDTGIQQGGPTRSTKDFLGSFTIYDLTTGDCFIHLRIKEEEVDKNLLELWGHTLLGMAKISEGTQNFYNLFDNGFAKKAQNLSASQEEFVELCQRAFGAEGIETFNSIMKEFYENVGVVPRAEYHALQAKYVDLKKKVQDLEEKIKGLKQQLKTGTSTPSDLMEQWTETAEKYAEINQQFFEEFSKFFK